MTLICVASPKGGVGKTMIAAHLADEMRRCGIPNVIAIDLDPQNALRLHFGIPLGHRQGIAACVSLGRPWEEAALRSSGDIVIYPFGSLGQREFDSALTLRPDILVDRVLELARQRDTVVLVDTSPGYSLSLSTLLPEADLLITVMTADASCISLMPDIYSGRCYDLISHGDASYDHRIIVNRFDPLNRVSTMAMPQIVQRLGSLHLGTIFRDEHVGEAYASQKLLNAYAPFSRAATDLELIGSRLMAIVGRA